MGTIPNGNDIAIIGTACRVSGADSPSELWDVLASSVDTREEINRFNSAGFHSNSDGNHHGLTNVKHAYLLRNGIDKFDNGFFEISSTEAAAMDPQHRLVLEVAYEAFESAGISIERLAGSNTAVFLGVSGSDYATSLQRDIDTLPKYHSTGSSIAICANRISYQFDLRGPSMVIDTACSSSATAFHQAVLALKAEECSMALVSATNLILDPDSFVHMSNLGFLSPEGICHSFDSTADGYARGEGVLSVILKPLSQAIKDGDPIRSIIRGSSINQDGHTNGITLPSANRQKENMEMLYSRFAVDPDEIQYFEAHGTGTAVGDPLEVSAITQTFGKSNRNQKLVVGSVKASVGHLEAGAALIGIIKTIECLERGMIPAQKHFSIPNPKIDFTHVQIPTSLLLWPDTAGLPRRAAINSFGFGGTNCHIVLEHSPPEIYVPGCESKTYVFKISASSEFSLHQLARKYAQYVSSNTPDLRSLAYTTLTRRSTLANTQYIIASKHGELVEKLRNSVERQIWKKGSLPTPIGFIFTGQGAQWHAMGATLLESSKVFQSVIERVDKVLQSLPDKPQWKLRQELEQPFETSSINTPAIAQTACTALQIGLVEIWKSWGIAPHFVVGHSSGEIAACYAAGAYSLPQTILIAYYRGKYVQEHRNSKKTTGAMCAVGLDEGECVKLLQEVTGYATIAAVNSQLNCTLSGDRSAIQSIQQLCQDRQIFCRMLKVDVAYHSLHMKRVAEKYRESLETTLGGARSSSAEFTCDFFSTAIDEKLTPANLSSEYWVTNLCSTVKFSTAVLAATEAYSTVSFLEIGPHPALRTSVNDIVSQCGKNINYFHSVKRDASSFHSMLESAVEMMGNGFDINKTALNFSRGEIEQQNSGARVLTNLPSYVWDHSKTHWAESRASRQLRFREFPRHPILGSRTFGDNPTQMLWRNCLQFDDLLGIDGILTQFKYSASPAFCIVMALEAIRQVQITYKLCTDVAQLRDVEFHSLLPLDATEANEFETCLSLVRKHDSNTYTMVISTLSDSRADSWNICCSANVRYLEASSVSYRADINRPVHNSEKVQYLNELNILNLTEFDDLYIGADKVAGRLSSRDPAPNPSRLLAQMAAVLQVPELQMLFSTPLTRHSIQQISFIQIFPAADDSLLGSFNTEHALLSTVRSTTNITYTLGDGVGLRLEEVYTKSEETVGFEPTLRSVFYIPRTLPDISLFQQSAHISIKYLLELVTHKWPMCDIGIGDVTKEEFDIIKIAVDGPSGVERRRYRSLRRMSSEAVTLKKAKYHIIFGRGTESSTHISGLDESNPRILACVPLNSQLDRELFEKSFEPVCEITGISEAKWVLGKGRLLGGSTCSACDFSLQVIVSKSISKLSQHDKWPEIRTSFLRDNGEISPQIELGARESRIIVLDCEETSLLIDEAKSNFMSWFQPLLSSLKSVVWVTTRRPATPFGDVAGSFIKTLLSEYPLLHATNLIIEDMVTADTMLDWALDAHAKLLEGRKETEIVIKNSQTWITRYQHDDSLQAAVGLRPPRKIKQETTGQFWQIIPAPAHGVTLRMDKRPMINVMNPQMISVNVTSSVIDHFDIVLLQSRVDGPREEQHLGHFFSGIVIHSQDSNVLSTQQVVGWHSGAHCSRIVVNASRTHQIPEDADTQVILGQYAAYSIALALIDGAARPRKDEVVCIQIPGILGEALHRLCIDTTIQTCENPSYHCDFLLSFDSQLGFLLNGCTVDLGKYLESPRLLAQIQYYLTPNFALYSQITTFKYSQLEGAFESAKQQPGSTLLVRNEDTPALDLWVSRTPSVDLFKSNAAYIVVGGLGGLGQHFMEWMIQRGARRLVTFSRRGMKSPGAEELVFYFAELGATLEILSVDTCDPHAVKSAVSQVRSSGPIRGYFNMSIRLERAPLSTMTPKQWEIAVQTKVKSSWNLHVASLQDEVDMFVMFSSIASIAGNRTQANYAVGNCFQNSLATYRKSSLGIPGLAIALGAMKEVGILAGEDQLMKTLSNTGLHCYDLDMFDKIVEAGILESYSSDKSILGTGLERFRNIDGVVKARPEQNQIFWSDWPEFGYFFDYTESELTNTRAKTLLEKIQDSSDAEQHLLLYGAFSECLSNVLGRNMAGLDPDMSIAAFGLDSLNTITCRYWFFKNLHVDVPVFDILACKSINALLSRVLTQLNTIHKSENAPILPEPVHYAKGSVEFRPISHSQQRMWFLQHYLEEKTINNLLLESEVTGKVHTDSFSKAWTVFVQRHESLHSCIVNTPRGLQQLPIQNHYFPFSITETSSDSFEKTCKEVRHVLRSHIYDLEAGNLVQGRLVRSSSGQTRFFLASHHIAWDRASVKTIFNETAAIYKAIQRGDDALLFMDSDPYQFIDYTLWQNTLLSEESFVEPHLKYWTKQLENLPISVSLLPTALVQSRPEFKRHSFDEVDLVFDAGSTILLHRFCQQSSITPFMLVTSTLALLISRLTGDQDVVIGIADSDRGHSAFDDLVGFTVNLLAIRARFETNDTSYLDFLEKYRQTCLEAYRHRALPFDVLLHKLNIPRSTSHSQAFQIVVNYQTAGGFKDCDYGDFKLTNYSHYNARPQSDFRLEVEETSSGELQCLWTYDVSLYSKETMTQVAERFRGLMKEALSSNPQTKLSDFFIPQIRAINASTEIYFKDTGSSSLKHLNPNKSHFAILFDQAVSKHPGKAAITDSERSITYEELGLYVARIETHLRSLGLQPGTSIGICCPPDTHLAVAMYGIVHAGLAYVPIDIDFPQERIISMIQDAGIRTILTGNVEMSQMANLGIEVDFVKLDELLGVEDITNAEIQSQDSATSHRGFCTIFTSGTTGRPKGIVVGHQQLRCQMQSYHDYLKTNESDIMLLASSITFDMSLTSIYGSILRGASLVIASREMRYSPQQLLEFVVKNKVTNCALTTTQLKFLLLGNSSNFSRWTSLKSLVVGGEEVPPWVAADFYALGLPDATLYNGYGPAETTVCNALNKIVASDCNEAALSIGSPLFPARFDLLDEELNKVPHGYEGELCIGGDVVNEGYMNHEDLTATAFIEDPIRRTNLPNSSIGKLYRTGDRARMGDDGRFYILGRINGDRQVKIRGMRTDLDEIESATLKALKCLDKEMFGISLVAVVCDKDQLLTAYLMAEEWRVETAIGKQELIRTLRLRLRASLLTHMIPRHFCIVLNIPQTPSGKTDYKALQAMPLEGILALNEAHSLDIRITPSSVEMKLAAIWKNVLHLKAEPSLEDDFFSLGGHSLILLDVQREMFQQFQVKVSLVDIFTNSSFQSLVKLVSTRLPEDVGSIASAHRMSEDESGSEILCTPETEPVEDVIDWAYEARLPLSVHHLNSEQHHSEARQNIIIVGACTMAGSHLLSHLLATVSTKIYCVGVNCPDDFNTTPKSLVVKELDHWGLPHYDLDRVVAYHGSLSQEALGLSEQQILKLKATVGSIYIMDSEVSLLKGYEDLRLSNVESLRFLVQLAFGNATAPAMETHYLSTWGVPHLQAWNDTKMMSDGLVKIECEMAHMEPSSEGSLGYLKARWVCEKLLCSAAREGLPVTIYRSCMCGSSRDSSTPLDKGDINRRILEGILQTGLVPDFGSAEGGGMSWISADFLVQSMCFLAQQPREILKQARFYHIVAEDHVPYTELAALLEKSHEGRSLVTVSPSEWFRTLRSGGTVDMVMHAEVLETWVNAGWLPFQMDAESTLCLLRKHGIVPPIVDKNFLQKHVIGDIGF